MPNSENSTAVAVSPETDCRQGRCGSPKSIGRVAGKKDFAGVAKELSEDNATKSQCGDLGWLWEIELVPSAARVVDFLKPGQFTSTPITVSDKLGDILRLHVQQQVLARPREGKQLER